MVKKQTFKNTDFGVELIKSATTRFQKIKIIIMNGRRLLRTINLKNIDADLPFSDFLITISHSCVDWTSIVALEHP